MADEQPANTPPTAQSPNPPSDEETASVERARPAAPSDEETASVERVQPAAPFEPPVHEPVSDTTTVSDESPVEETKTAKSAGFWKNLKTTWTSYHAVHRNSVFYGFLGLLVALGILFFGFWRALLVVLLIFLGVSFGQYLDGDPRVFNFFRNLFKKK